MTLGRTADSKIKIKTDEEGTPRAVECSCCVECGYASVSGTLKDMIESATQITVNGTTQSWNGVSSRGYLGYGEVSWAVDYTSGTLFVTGDNGDNTVTLGDGCLFTTGPDIQINGESFTSSHAFDEFQISMEVTFS